MSQSRNQPNREDQSHDNGLVELVEELGGIIVDEKTAELNKISMLDSKGSRIYF